MRILFDIFFFFFFSSRRRHTRSKRDWSSDVCSSDLRCRLATSLLSLNPGVTPRGDIGGSYMDQNTFTVDGGNNTDDMAGNTIGYIQRSEERRVGKECRSRRAQYKEKKKERDNVTKGV